MIRKTIFLALAILACSNVLCAQTWSEWFKQKKTQKQYLLKQIALLNTYVGYVKKGYDIADKGLTAINDFKDGEFSLHREFFGARKTVNPHLANSAKVADIIAFQVFVIRNLKSLNQFCANANGLTPEDVRYITSVYLNMIRLCDASLSELLDIVFNDKLEMTDDQRMNRIDRLHEESQDRVAFAKQFEQDVKSLSYARASEMNAVSATYSQFGLH
jgi:hypothetical protein